MIQGTSRSSDTILIYEVGLKWTLSKKLVSMSVILHKDLLKINEKKIKCGRRCLCILGIDVPPILESWHKELSMNTDYKLKFRICNKLQSLCIHALQASWFFAQSFIHSLYCYIFLDSLDTFMCYKSFNAKVTQFYPKIIKTNKYMIFLRYKNLNTKISNNA